MKLTRKEFVLTVASVAVAGCRTSERVVKRKEVRGMLKGISPVVSPDLLKVLAEMGHGDEIVFSDAHFPAHAFGRDGAIVLRADGLGCDRLLSGVIPLIELDSYATPAAAASTCRPTSTSDGGDHPRRHQRPSSVNPDHAGRSDANNDIMGVKWN